MVQCSIADEMQLVTLILLLCSSTKYIVNGNGMSKIEMKSINATCKGKSCDGYEFKICYSKQGGVPTCLHVYDTFINNYEPVDLQKFDNVSKQFDGIGLTVLPFTFMMYINDETIYDSKKRHQNGRTMVLSFQKDTGSFIQIELTSSCYDDDHCTGFLCQDCFTAPPTVTVPHSKAGVIRDNVTVPCNVSEVYRETVVTWIKNNGNFDTIINIDDNERFVGGTYKSPDLTIMSAQKEDEGNYTCQAQNLDFKGSSLPVYLSIFEYPVVNVSNIGPVIEGTNITIPCYVSPTSEVNNITWYKNNSELDIYANDRFSGGTISSPTLKINFVKEYDEGNYTCQATNPIGTIKSEPTHLTILPDIPKVRISRIEAVNVGDNVIISCNISSVSELTKIVWSKNNIEFNLNANRTKDDDRFSGGTLQDPSLTIYTVHITDEGNYVCNATNAAEQTGWSNLVHLTVFEATTEILPSTDIIFSTSELSTPSSDIISTDQVFSTSELSTPSSDIISTDIIFSTSDLTTLISNTTSSTFATTKTSTVPSSVKTTITTTSAKVPSTKSPNSSSTVNMSTTTSSTLSSTSKSTTSPPSTKSPSTVMSTVRPTTIHTTVSFSSNLPTHTIISTPSTNIPYRSSTVKTSTTTSSTVKTSTTTSSTVKTSTTTSPIVKTSTLTSSTSKSPVSPSSAVGSTGNSENLNAWVITTTVICVVEFIVIVLVVYILWLRKQRRLALQYEKEETVF